MTVESGYEQVNGVRLHYLRAGEGPRAVVFVHGHSHCCGVWLPIMEALAGDRYTAVSLDLRGHGWSDKPDDGYRWQDLRDDVAGLVRALDLQQVIYSGHSRGGGVALLAAAATPGRTRGVFVYEPTVPVLVGEDGRPAPIVRATEQMAQRAERRRTSFPSRAAMAAHYRSRPAFQAWRQDAFDAFVAYGIAENEDGTASPCLPPGPSARLYDVMFEFDAWRDVSCPELPVRVLFGERSPHVMPGHSDVTALRLLFPRAEGSVLPGATHTGPMEQPALFASMLRDFDASVNRTSQAG